MMARGAQRNRRSYGRRRWSAPRSLVPSEPIWSPHQGQGFPTHASGYQDASRAYAFRVERIGLCRGNRERLPL